MVKTKIVHEHIKSTFVELYIQDKRVTVFFSIKTYQNTLRAVVVGGNRYHQSNTMDAYAEYDPDLKNRSCN